MRRISPWIWALVLPLGCAKAQTSSSSPRELRCVGRPFAVVALSIAENVEACELLNSALTVLRDGGARGLAWRMADTLKIERAIVLRYAFPVLNQPGRVVAYKEVDLAVRGRDAGLSVRFDSGAARAKVYNGERPIP